MKTLVVCLVLLFVVWAFPPQVEASFDWRCIAGWAIERCHPEDGGEPPADCGFWFWVIPDSDGEEVLPNLEQAWA